LAKKIPVKLILELKKANLSQREIARTRKISRHSISSVFKLATELSVTYDDVAELSSDEVYQMFFPDKHISETLYQEPDYELIHSELKKTGVNLKLLWNEYKDSCIVNNAVSMGYTRFCKGYTEHISENRLTNHLKHKPGVICEVDWSGKTMSLIDKHTGELVKVYLFVATLPYSYVEPCLDMKQNTWLQCHVNMYNYFGGSTIRLICDNLKTGVISHPKEGDIILNDKYEDLGNHYMTAIMPAGVKKPKHKPSVEGTVGKIATAIIARLRNQSFYNISDLRVAVKEKLNDFNSNPFQKREGSRRSVFLVNEKPYLREIPDIPYTVADWIYGHKVNIDCHVSFETNRYSAPYKYVGKIVDIRATDLLVEIYFNKERICTHNRLPSYARYQWSTDENHMPDHFQNPTWDDERILNWASTIGPNTSLVINRIFDSLKIKEQGYNSALSVLKLSKKYNNLRLEIACELALEKIHSPRYRNLNSILSSNQDELYHERKTTKDREKTKVQGYVRGTNYYSGGGK
jgi:transposase